MLLFKKRRKNPEKRKNKLRSEIEKKWQDRYNSATQNHKWVFEGMPPAIQTIIDRNDVAPASSVLDLGCGFGQISWLLSKEGFNVTGIDISQTIIDQAKQNYPPESGKLNYIKGDATCPLELNDTFDIAIDRGTFHGLPKSLRTDYASTISQSLKEDGRLFVFYSVNKARRQYGHDIKKTDEIIARIYERLEQHFVLDSFQDSAFENDKRDDVPAYLLILKKRNTVQE